MTYINREIDSFLSAWRNSNNRKPILLRGARQVGKTETIRNFGKSFNNFVEINFVHDSRIKKIFQNEILDPHQIIQAISGLYSTKIIEGKTLLFFDEIQACPEAIESLRFFYDKLPNLHLVTAGSLLEFVLSDLKSFGVGKVTSIFMRPMSIKEFFIACGKAEIYEMISFATDKKPLHDVIHKEALSLLKNYSIVGGLPESVSTFLNTKNIFDSMNVLESLRQGYEDDFSKYAKNVPIIRLKDTLRSIAYQSGSKFVFSQAYVDAISSQVHGALSLLEMAGLAHRVHHTSANGIPIGAEIKPSKFKVIPHDVGVFQRLLGLSGREFFEESLTSFVNRGALGEVIVGIEIMSSFDFLNRGDLWYWHREAKNSSAEVDYVAQYGNQIIPFEVKANKKGSMKSLRIFMEEKKSKIGIRLSSENFSKFQNILIVPIYATREIERLVQQIL